MNWLFYVILIFFILFCVYGYQRGLLRMLYSVVAFVISVAAMFVLAPIFSSMLKEHTPLMEEIQQPIKEVLVQQLENGKNLDSLLEEYCHLPDTAISKIQALSAEGGALQAETVAQQISGYCADYICNMIAYAILFFLIRITLGIAGKMLHIIGRLPVLSTMNRLGGLTLGAIEAIGCVWIFFLVVDACRATQLGMQLFSMIINNEILYSLYQNNYFLLLFGRI